MVTKRRVMLIAVLLIAVLGISPLTAQINRFSSNTNLATSGLFDNDTDDFLDVNNWQNVEFDTFFSTVQVDNLDGRLGAGLALRAGEAYLGFGYFGTLWQGNINSVRTEAGGNRLVTRPFPDANNNLTWTNQLSVLFGMDMLGGFLLDLNFAGFGRTTRDSDVFDDGNVVTNENTTGLGELEVGLRWGRNFELENGLTLKPTLGFSYNTNRARTEERPAGGTRTTTLNGIDPFFSRTDLGFVELNDGRVGLTGGFNVHAGMGVDRAFGDTDASLWVSYDLNIRTYDRQRTGSGEWADFAPSFARHLINIGVGAWYTLDRRLSFAWSAECAIGIISAEATSMQDQTGLPPNHQFAVSIVEISPKFAAGVVFQAIHDRFNVNASLALFPFIYRRTQVDHNNLAMVETIDRTETIFSNIRTYTSAGFTWFLGDNLSFDAALTAAPAARIDVTSFSLLLSYKR